MGDDPDENYWRLEGYDSFDRSYYGLPGRYKTEAEALKAAEARLAELEITQPTAMSGGQKGIQDKVCIVPPKGFRRDPG